METRWYRATRPGAACSAALLLGLGLAAAAAAEQAAPPASPAAAASAAGLLPMKTYSAQEDAQTLALFEGLRVADVTDGMDVAGLPDAGLVDPEIRPLWRDTETFAHRFCGLAVTVRYVPTNRARPKLAPEEFPKWESEWYQKLSPEPFVELLRPGSVVVIDGTDDNDTGTIGSNNILAWKLKGAVGVVTSGGARDTDEIIKEKVPLYLRRPGRGIRPGRNEVESVNRRVTLGGVLVRPGDVIVADGDGVVVVPREHAETVARAARAILESDKVGRRGLYKQLGLPEDATVLPGPPTPSLGGSTPGRGPGDVPSGKR